jgi:hypothetical protein
MKSLLLTIAASVITMSAQAKIFGSTLEEDHQALIEASIAKSCYVNPFMLEQLDSKVIVVRVDQGIKDVYYTTHLKLKERIDQGVFNNYDVVVKSILFDQYDHENKRWGAYVVEAVNCKPSF